MSNIDYKLLTSDNIEYVNYIDNKMTIGVDGIEGHITYHQENNKVYHVKHTGIPLEVVDKNVTQIIRMIAVMCVSPQRFC